MTHSWRSSQNLGICTYFFIFFFFFLPGDNSYRKMNQIFCMVLNILPQLCLLHFVVGWLPAEENHLFWYVTPLCPAWLYNPTGFHCIRSSASRHGKSLRIFWQAIFSEKPPAAQKQHVKCKDYSFNFWKSFLWPQWALNATLNRNITNEFEFYEVRPLDSDNVFY